MQGSWIGGGVAVDPADEGGTVVLVAGRGEPGGLEGGVPGGEGGVAPSHDVAPERREVDGHDHARRWWCNCRWDRPRPRWWDRRPGPFRRPRSAATMPEATTSDDSQAVPSLLVVGWCIANHAPPVGAMPTAGWSSGIPPIEPWNLASPKAKMPPSAATSQ